MLSDCTFYTIELSPLEMALADIVGEVRHSQNDEAGHTNHKIANVPAIDIDRLGAAGEIAACKLLKCYPDLSPSVRFGTPDCVYGSIRIDVKATECPNGHLIGPLQRNPDVDAFVLMIRERALTWRMAGWCWTEELYQPENLREHGYWLSQDKLRRGFPRREPLKTPPPPPPTFGKGAGRSF